MTDVEHNDPLDPRASLPPAERRRLQDMARETAQRVWADLRASLGLDDEEPDPDAWTTERVARRAMWNAIVAASGSVDAAIAAIERQKRRDFAVWLHRHERIGEGVTVS